MRGKWSEWERHWPTCEVKGANHVHALQPLHHRMINGTVPPDFSTGDTIQIVNRLADQTLPLAMKTEWTELLFLQIRAGNTAARSSCGRPQCFSDAGGAL